MALVSEFLGQLTLSYGAEAEPVFPTVVAFRDFDPIGDAARLDAALRSKGVDEQSVIDILTRRSYEQRREIAFEYERLAKKDLQTALKGALSGSLEALMLGLMKSPAQYDALELKAAMKGLGTDEETLIEIVCSRSDRELADIQKVYREVFKKELEKDVAGDTSGDFAKLLLALIQTTRDQPSNVIDYEKIDDDAKSLYEAGVKRKGTDVAVWIGVLTRRSAPHLRRVFQRYKSYSPYDLKESIGKEVKGDLEKSFLALVECLEDKQAYFADRLNEAMKGKGAKDKVLTRILVSRCQVDLMKIRSVFKKRHGRSLYRAISVRTRSGASRARSRPELGPPAALRLRRSPRVIRGATSRPAVFAARAFGKVRKERERCRLGPRSAPPAMWCAEIFGQRGLKTRRLRVFSSPIPTSQLSTKLSFRRRRERALIKIQTAECTEADGRARGKTLLPETAESAALIKVAVRGQADFLAGAGDRNIGDKDKRR